MCCPTAVCSDAVPASLCARVLVVDDEPGIVELLRDMLEAAGLVVSTASSGRDALQQVAQQRFDLVVSDLRMPDTDGAGLWRALCTQQPALAQRMLFVTGDTLSQAASAFLADTGCLSLDKPFSRAELMQRVRLLLPR
jgi:two-component system NtrC family sensor kinase